MTSIYYHNEKYESADGESVLDTLLRHDVDVPYACKAGVCHVCVMVCEQGELPYQATLGMSDSLAAQGNFLACQCKPEQDVTIRDADECGLFSPAYVAQKVNVSENICRIRLRLPTQLYYRAGQFINIQSPQGQIRSYSLASLPTQDDFLELYIKRMRNGVVSNWLFNDVSEGDKIQIQGPYGDCFYHSNVLDNNLLMIGTGTGLTPLVGILRDAISCGHRGQIYIYHGERSQRELFYHQELITFSNDHANIHYFPCVSSENESLKAGVFAERASNLAMSNHADLDDFLIYLCGSPSMVNQTQEKAHIKGAPQQCIYIDPFVTKELRSSER